MSWYKTLWPVVALVVILGAIAIWLGAIAVPWDAGFGVAGAAVHGPHCTYDDMDVDPHFESVEQLNEWLSATRPAIDACPNGGWDKSKIDWSQVPWMQPF